MTLLSVVAVYCNDYSEMRDKEVNRVLSWKTSLPMLLFPVMIEHNQMYFVHLFV